MAQVIYFDDGADCTIYANGYRYWHLKNVWHRLDGPAIEFDNGYFEWWINGIKYSEEDYNIIIQCPWII